MHSLARSCCVPLVSCGMMLAQTSPGDGQAVKASVVTSSLLPGASSDWTRDLGYGPSEIHALLLGTTGIPLVQVNVASVPLWLFFDTGTSRGFVLTEHAAPVPYHDEGRTEELNADDSHRGESRLIRVDSLLVLGKVFRGVPGRLLDWHMLSSEPLDGTVGLDFFLDRRVTLDYRSLKVGVSDAAIPESLDQRRYVVLDLIDSRKSQGHVLYARARVDGRDAIVYFDTGYNVSFIDPDFAADLPRVERPGRFPVYRERVPLELAGQTIILDDLRETPIRRGDGFPLPVALVLGSDVLSQFIVTVDIRAKKLVLGAAKW